MLDRQGLVSSGDTRRLPLTSEAALYRHLGLPYLPPEVREDAVDLDGGRAVPRRRARRGSDIQGMVHCHTVYSDGSGHDRGDGARGRSAMGMRYMTITDHSPTASYAGGPHARPATAPVGRDRRGAGAGRRSEILRGTESRHPRRRRARLPGRDPRAARRRHRQHPQPPPDGRGADDPAPGAGDAPSVLQDLGPRARALRAAPSADRVPDRGGAGRRRRIAGGDRGERGPEPAGYGAALDARGAAGAASASSCRRMRTPPRSSRTSATGSTWRGAASSRRGTC